LTAVHRKLIIALGSDGALDLVGIAHAPAAAPSTPNDGAAAWITAHWPIPEGKARDVPARLRKAIDQAGADYVESSWPRSAPLIGVSSDTVITPPCGMSLPSLASSPARVDRPDRRCAPR
jgi:hypothetical protein